MRLALAEPKLHDAAFWSEGDVLWLAAVNEHGGIRYVNHEALEQLLQWLALAAAPKHVIPIAEVMAAAKVAEYRYDAMVALLIEPKKAAVKSVKAAAKPAVTASTKKIVAKKTVAKKASAVAAAATPAKEQPASTTLKVKAAEIPEEKIAVAKKSAPKKSVPGKE